MELKMRLLCFLILGLLTITASAEVFETAIHSVDLKYKFVRFKNGQVGHFKKAPNVSSGERVRVELDGENRVVSIKRLGSSGEILSRYKTMQFQNAPEFVPTVLPNMQAAQKLHESLNDNYVRRSECTDRAHVWAYDMFKNQGIQSRKAFIFFTASYINRNKFKWWFHVAPTIDVKENGKVEQKFLDFMLIDRPVSVQEWTNLQVYSKRACKMTSKFSEYDVNPQTEDCYMIYESMYYRLPGDIHAQELRNEYRSTFNESEVSFARKTGFKSQVELP